MKLNSLLLMLIVLLVAFNNGIESGKKREEIKKENHINEMDLQVH